MQIDEYLGRARAFDGSDLHLTKELPPIMRQNGSLRPLPDAPVLGEDAVEALIGELCGREGISFGPGTDDADFCYHDETGRRYRVNLYHQNGGPGRRDPPFAGGAAHHRKPRAAEGV